MSKIELSRIQLSSSLCGFGSLSNKLSKNLKMAILRDHEHTPITRIIDAFCFNATSGNNISDEYLYFDPRALVSKTKPRLLEFHNVIVFIVGGGNYIAYGYMSDWGIRSLKNVINGCTSLYNGSEFLKEIATCASI